MRENDRYSRQRLFAPIGAEGQTALASKQAVIVGMGALGAVLANHIVRAGIGHVRLIDRDFVEFSNLQRQMLYTEDDAKQSLPKAFAAAEHLRQANSEVHIEPIIADVSYKNAEVLLRDADIILDGTDNFAVRFLINDIAVKYGIPWVYGGAVASGGTTVVIVPGETPCLRCLFREAPSPGTVATCDTSGVIGPIIHIIASFQATEALKILVGDTAHRSSKLIQIDVWDNRYHGIEVGDARQTDCPCCGERRFDYLNVETPDVTVLCGRDTVQVTLSTEDGLDLDKMEAKLKTIGPTERNRFLLRASVGDCRLVLFADGRCLVQGTDDPALARSLVARYIGT